jgi:hypothetical protein
VQLLREKGFQNIWIVSRKSDGKANTLTWVHIVIVRNCGMFFEIDL